MITIPGSDLPPGMVEPFMSVLALSVGLILGSFLNVCIYRLPVGHSVVKPRSRCPGCGNTISWYDNIPVISWVLLRASCRRCSKRIPVRYPFVELLSGVTVFMLWRVFGPSAEFAIGSAFALALIVLFFTDYDHQLLPDAITLSGFVVGMGVAWFNPFLGDPGWARVWSALGGAALGSGLLWSVGAIYGKLRGVEAMGMGDVKMMAMVGAFAGPTGVLFTIFAASVFGAVFGVLLIPLLGRSLQDKLPFGCFLAPAALVALFYGRAAVDAYFKLILPPV
jgi:leader peptidase (prepilin peptidase)/N-methyltransferase